MKKSLFFFRLRWKLAILLGCIVLILQSAFSYMLYMETKQHFADERKLVETSHIHIARLLTEHSYSDLEQFAKGLSSVVDFKSPHDQVLSKLDENWPRLQASSAIENVSFLDKQAVRVKFWGKDLTIAETLIQQVLDNKAQVKQVYCKDSCYQQVIVPLMYQSEVEGVLSVIRSISNVKNKFKQETKSDFGVLTADETMGLKSSSVANQSLYKLSEITAPEKNQPLFDHMVSSYVVGDFLGHYKTVEFGNSVYDITIFPAQAAAGNGGALFLLLNDMTVEVTRLNEALQRIWINWLISLSLALLLMMLLLHVSLHRIEILSRLFPMLLRNKYTEFKQQMLASHVVSLGFDELDQLNQSALYLSDQLEHLEQEVRGNNFMLLEKSQDLAKERDFIRQLVETAPIIIITQKLNGIILSVNQAGIDGFEADSHSIIGKVFDIFVPESDQEHLKKLNQLRMGDRANRFQINGFLVTQSGKQRETSWLHTLLKPNDGSDEPVILSLGVDISSRNIEEEKIQKMSSYDELTGLNNRKKFQEEFAVELASAKRYGYRVALFYLDMDEFKGINDHRDHEVGDYLLQQVATILKDAMRSTDLLCRIDGDEFTLIMPHAELQGIQQNASKINQMLKSAVFSYRGEDYQLTTSIGIAVYPQHGLTVNELLVNAAVALDQAKVSGGATYQLFSPDQEYQEKLNQKLYWQEIIENAIAQDKFLLLYQPVINIKSSEINHYECLIRLQKEDGTLILPAEFMGFAEDLELIGKIDRWVIKKAVQKKIEYHRQGRSCKLSINLSAAALDDATIFEDISRLVTVPEVDPQNIIFEITETAAVSNFAAAETLITQLKALGCLLALDDFGIGFSSIYYLKHFPVDYIKLDGSFISQIDKNEDDKVFVKAVTGLAHTFNKKVVAEFVENEAILNVINDFGIDYGQGNYLGLPAVLDGALDL